MLSEMIFSLGTASQRKKITTTANPIVEDGLVNTNETEGNAEYAEMHGICLRWVHTINSQKIFCFVTT